jgi:putative PIN family toxin of toxin-antitoxin system
MLRHEGFNRRIIRACLTGSLKPLVGQTLFLEYEDVLGRRDLFRRSPLTREERQELFAAFLSVSDWVHVYYSWRPNLPDESDNHIMELAVAGNASMIITNNVRHFRQSELRFPDIRIISPRTLVNELA